MIISREQRLPTAIAALALFVALGGTSYAAVKLNKGSVTSREVKNGSLQAVDLAPGVVTSGPSGPRGPRGAEGPAGSPTARVYINRSAATTGVTSSRAVFASLRLPAGHYHLDFTAHPYWQGATVWVDCSIEIDGKAFSDTAVSLGADANGASEQSMAISDATTLTASSTVTVACNQRGQNHAVRIPDVRLVATRVGALEVQ